jgi:lactoylglutathione lyase
MPRLDYVILYVADLARSRAFYEGVLGLPFRMQGEGYVEFAVENVKFGLYERARLPVLVGATDLPTGGGMEIALLVEDVNREAERLRRAGVALLSGPADRPWGHRTIHFRDPDGHVIELAQQIARAH